MESPVLDFWGYLAQATEGRSLLRQRIPEVCVFRGCQLDGWYHNNANGMVVRRRQRVSLEAMLESFSAPAKESAKGPETPVAILRSPLSDSAVVDNSAGPRVPHATVITAQGLSELVQNLQVGKPPSGVTEDTCAWSLQEFIEPTDDVRAISVYSCDAMAVERSDIFGRRYNKVYRMVDAPLTMPMPEDVAADRCIELTPGRRASLESRTLSIVRFMSRFFNKDFEGLTLEFVFDSQSRPVLHACWASTFFGSEPRRKIHDAPSTSYSSSAKEIPKSFPVPSVDPDIDEWPHHQTSTQGSEQRGSEHRGSDDSLLEGDGAPGDRAPAAVSTAAAGGASSAVRQRRPMSARGRLESGVATSAPGGRHIFTHLEGNRPCRTQSERALHSSSTRTTSRRNTPPKLQTSVLSPREVVCGAEMSSHWGMTDEGDGNMSTCVLARQICERLSARGVNGLSRSAMLTQIAQQLQQYHQVQAAWDEQFDTAKSAADKKNHEIQCKDSEVDAYRVESKRIVQEKQDRMADKCKEACSHVHDLNCQTQDHQNKLGRSQKRISEQQALVKHLQEESRGLDSSLEKTHRKFDEVSSRFQKTQDDDSVSFVQRAGVGPSGMPNAAMELRGAETRADSLANESKVDRAELLDMKTRLSRLKAQMAGEASHASKLEDFVKRIAEGPSAKIRCGGGFTMDSTAKREAIGLLKEAAPDVPMAFRGSHVAQAQLSF